MYVHDMRYLHGIHGEYSGLATSQTQMYQPSRIEEVDSQVSVVALFTLADVLRDRKNKNKAVTHSV
jgi:hypothetical protein